MRQICHQILHVHNILVYNILSSPRGAWAFDELRGYHTRPLQLDWGPENVHFGKTHFRDPNIDARSSKNAEKEPKPFPYLVHISYKDKSLGKIPFLKKLTEVHLEIDQNGKLVSLKKKTCFFGVFDQNFGPQKFPFFLGNGQKRPNGWGSGKSFKKNIAWANNRYVNRIFPNKTFNNRNTQNQILIQMWGNILNLRYSFYYSCFVKKLQFGLVSITIFLYSISMD